MSVSYVYYDPSTKQIEAYFESAKLSINANCEAKGLVRAIVPPGFIWSSQAERDNKIETFGANGDIKTVSVSINVVQVAAKAPTRLENLQCKIDDDTATLSDVKEYLRLRP